MKSQSVGVAVKSILAEARQRTRARRAAAGTGIIAVTMGAASLAGPELGNVAAGQASVAQSGTQTTVTQSSDRVVINWNSFNVGADEAVQFVQPGSDSAALNRITGNDASTILGRISANGQVYLVNPNGMVFGRSAQVDVGSLVASTSGISTTDFMAGRLHFTEAGRPGASIDNQGSITVAEGGFAGLVGSTVRNSGYIHARFGRVTLAAGDAFILDLNGDQLINLVVDPAQLAEVTDAAGVPLSAYVDHSGEIIAEGGRVTLAAGMVQRLLDNVVNVSGVIRATAFESRPGVISLLGNDATRVTVSGTLDASGRTGGEINATGGTLQLAASAVLDASASTGDGGRVFVGGNWQGQGPLANARQVDVERGALVNASGGADGRGGTVAIWSDDATRFSGTILATGGIAGGNVEVSGRQRLAYDGHVRAANLLLDPTNVFISGSSGETVWGTAPETGDYTVHVDAINRALVSGTSVTVQATEDITINANAVVGAARDTTAGGGLRLDAGGDITLDGSVILNDGDFGAVAGGRFAQGASSVVATGSGDIAVSAAQGIEATNLFTTGAVTLTSSAGAVQAARTISGAGNERVASLDIQGRDGVVLAGGALVAGPSRLESSQGQVSTSGATLDSVGSVTLAGSAGVVADGIRTQGALVATSAAGGVTLDGPIAGGTTIDIQAGQQIAVNGDMTAGDSLSLRAGGAITLDASIVLDNAALQAQAGGALTQGAASVLATGTGSIDISAGGALRATNLQSTGAVTLASSGGSVEVSQAISGSTGARAGSLDVQGRDGVTLAQGALVAGITRLASSQGQVDTTGGTLDSLGAVTLEGNSAVSADAIRAQGTMVLTSAGGDVTINGPLVAASAVGIQSGGDITLDGDSAAAGAFTLDSGNTISLNGSVALDDADFTATADGAFLQSGTAVIATGTGDIGIAAAAGIQGTNLLATGAVTLASSAGAVQVTQALSGADGARVAALDIHGRDGVTLAQGAMVAGMTDLSSGLGQVRTTGGTLDSLGNVTVTGHTGVLTGAILTPASVALASATGGVTATGAIGGSTLIDETSTPALGLSINAAGAVALQGGAALGAGGLSIAGAAAGQRAASASFGSTGVFSAGVVDVDTVGDITLGAGGLFSSGDVLLTSSGGISTAAGGLQTTGTADITLQATGNINVGAGGQVSAQGGDVTLASATGNIVASGLLSSGGGTIDVTAGNGNITLADVVTWTGNASGSSGALLIEAGGDVVLTRALGGADTGYDLFADHYQADARPGVGRVEITAGQDVELNGLNLDGNTAAGDSGFGLSVVAGDRIVSNELIAVNKGAIRLLTTNPGALNGIYLGNSVYSRGYDPDGTQAGKVGYSITVGGTGAVGTRGNLFLFDNTDDLAIIADQNAPAVVVNGQQQHRIAKIVIANNVANYSDTATLVGAGNAATVTVGADRLWQTDINAIDVSVVPDGQIGSRNALTLARLPASAPVDDAAIGLKIQVFAAAGDSTTDVQAVRVAELFDVDGSDDGDDGATHFYGDCILPSCTYATAGLLPGVDSVRRTNIHHDPDGSVTQSVSSPSLTQELGFGIAYNESTILAYRLDRGASGDKSGSSAQFDDRIALTGPVQDITTDIVWTSGDSPDAGRGSLGYQVSGRLVQTVAGASPVTRELIYSGVIQSEGQNASFDSTGNLASGGVVPGASTMGTIGGSNAGFSPVGGFGGQVDGALVNAVPNPVTPPSPPPVGGVPNLSAPGTGTPGLLTSNPVIPVPPSPAPVVGNPVPTDPGVPPVTPDPTTPPPPVPDPTDPEGPQLADSDSSPGSSLLGLGGEAGDDDDDSGLEIVLGRRPSRDADMGRSSPVSGSADNVFGRAYLLAQSSDAAVCAPKDIHSRDDASAEDRRRECTGAN